MLSIYIKQLNKPKKVSVIFFLKKSLKSFDTYLQGDGDKNNIVSSAFLSVSLHRFIFPVSKNNKKVISIFHLYRIFIWRCYFCSRINMVCKEGKYIPFIDFNSIRRINLHSVFSPRGSK